MTLKNKLSLLCLGIIATNFVVNNNASAMMDYTNLNNSPFSNPQYSPHNRNLTNFNRYGNSPSSFSLRNNMKPSFQRGNSPSNSSRSNMSTRNNSWMTGVRNGRNNVFNINNKDDLSVIFSDNDLSSNISECFSKLNLANIGGATEYSDSVSYQLTGLLEANFKKDMTQLFKAFPELISEPRSVIKAIQNTFKKFGIQLYDSVSNIVQGAIPNNKNNNYYSSNNRDELWSFVTMIDLLSSNKFSRIQEDFWEIMFQMAEKFQDNVVFTTVLNGFIASLPNKIQIELLSRIVQNMKQPTAVGRKSNNSSNLVNLANSTIMQIAENYEGLLQQNTQISDKDQELFLNVIGKLSEVMIKNSTSLSTNDKNLLVNTYARLLRKIGSTNDVATFKGLNEKNSNCIVLTTHLLCNRANEKGYNNNLKSLLLDSSAWKDIFKMVTGQWCYFNGKDALPLDNNVSKIETTNVINLVNTLIDIAKNKTNIENAKLAGELLTKIRKYSCGNKNINTNNHEFIFDAMVYLLSNDVDDIKSLEKLLKRYGYGLERKQYHTILHDNVITVPYSDYLTPLCDVKFLQESFNNSEVMNEDVHISKSAWKEWFDDNLRRLTSTDNKAAIDKRIENRWFVINAFNDLFQKQDKFGLDDYVIGQTFKRQLCKKLCAYKKTEKSIKLLYENANNFIENAPIDIVQKLLSDYITYLSNDSLENNITENSLLNKVNECAKLVLNNYHSLLYYFRNHMIAKQCGLVKDTNKKKLTEQINAAIRKLVLKNLHDYLGTVRDDGNLNQDQKKIRSISDLLEYNLKFFNGNVNNKQLIKYYQNLYNKFVKGSKTNYKKKSDKDIAGIIKNIIQNRSYMSDLEYINNNGNANEVSNSLKPVFVSKNVEPQTLFNDCVDKSSILRGITQQAMMHLPRDYKTSVNDKLQKAYNNYLFKYTRNKTRINELDVNKLVNMIVDNTSEQLEILLRDKVLSESNDFNTLADSILQNKDNIKQVLTSSFRILKGNKIFNQKSFDQLKTDFFYSLFVMEQIVLRNIQDGNRLLSKQQLTIAQNNKYIMNGLLNGFKTNISINKNKRNEFLKQAFEQFKSDYKLSKIKNVDIQTTASYEDIRYDLKEGLRP